MVKVCDSDYPADKEEQYKEYFEKYPFELSTFQKYGIEAIIRGHHVLITAPVSYTHLTLPTILRV